MVSSAIPNRERGRVFRHSRLEHFRERLDGAGNFFPLMLPSSSNDSVFARRMFCTAGCHPCGVAQLDGAWI